MKYDSYVEEWAAITAALNDMVPRFRIEYPESCRFFYNDAEELMIASFCATPAPRSFVDLLERRETAALFSRIDHVYRRLADDFRRLQIPRS